MAPPPEDPPRDRGLAATPGIRHEAGPTTRDIGEEPELAARLRAAIAAGGPMPFATFMERALYEPGLGYYRRHAGAASGPGRAGDFLTAPEAHPVFGAAIGRLIEQAWEALGRPAPFVITEPGAGSGALALGLLDGLRASASPLFEAVRYRPVELDPAGLDAISDRLDGDGYGDLLVRAAPAGPEAGAVIANEVVDALPVHRVVVRDGRLRERYVDTTAQGFIEVEGPPSSPGLAARLAAEDIALAEGQVAEICLALDAWLPAATGHLERGVVVLVDYGEPAASLYRPGRPERVEGTIRAFARHAVGGNPLAHVGRQDLTAHVDLTAVERAAVASGLEPLGATTQAELLAAVGIGELVAATLRAPGTDLQAALELRSALARLMDPRGMGGFRVLAFGRAMSRGTALPGLARLRRPGT